MLTFKSLNEVPRLTKGQVHAYVDKKLADVNCWACGKDTWMLLTTEGMAAVSLTRLGVSSVKGEPFHAPHVTLECANCHTLWQISARAIHEAEDAHAETEGSNEQG